MRRLAVFALIVGCGPSIDFAEFPDAVIDARCEYLYRCGVVAQPGDCRVFHEHLAIDNPSPQAAYDAGKLQFHPVTAQACLDAYASLPCDVTEQEPDALDVCSRAITGTLGLGEACAFDKECTSENCDVAPCTSACCTGTCAEPIRLPTVGEACRALCADGAYCGTDDICHAPLPPGAACTVEPCVAGHYCKGPTSTSSGACAPYPQLGEPCDSVCAEVGATCYAGKCVESALLGDACTSDAQCSSYYQCSNMQCALMPTRGMACSTACSDDSWCESAVCVAQKANGSTCLRNDECLTHFCQRVGTGGTCADVPLCI